MQNNLPLAGLRVLDLSRALAGPFCALIRTLADKSDILLRGSHAC